MKITFYNLKVNIHYFLPKFLLCPFTHALTDLPARSLKFMVIRNSPPSDLLP